VETVQQRYPVDDITQQTACELQIHYKGLINMVAFGSALLAQAGELYHGQPIPAGYARVGVEELCKGYEMLELDIPRGDNENTLAQAVHGYILWEKRNIIIKAADQSSRPSSPQPPRSPPSPAAAPQHSPSPSSQGQPASPSPSPPLAKKQKQMPKKQAPPKEAPKKKEQRPKKAKEAPTLPWDKSYEESLKQSQKEVREHFKPKGREKKQPIDPKASAFFYWNERSK